MGLADGRIVGFKGGELWQLTRTGEFHQDCGKPIFLFSSSSSSFISESIKLNG